MGLLRGNFGAKRGTKIGLKVTLGPNLGPSMDGKKIPADQHVACFPNAGDM